MSGKHPHNELIDKVGPSVLRSQFGLSYQRLHAWRKRGIPHTHRAAVATLAVLAGAPLPPNFLAPPQADAA